MVNFALWKRMLTAVCLSCTASVLAEPSAKPWQNDAKVWLIEQGKASGVYKTLSDFIFPRPNLGPPLMRPGRCYEGFVRTIEIRSTRAERFSGRSGWTGFFLRQVLPPTHSKVLKAQLDIAEGDWLSQEKMVAVQEKLRAQPYLRQVYAFSHPCAHTSEDVRLTLVAQESFPMGLTLDKGAFLLHHKHLMGFGHQMALRMCYLTQAGALAWSGWGVSYKLPMATAGLEGKFAYQNTAQESGQMVSLQRLFSNAREDAGEIAWNHTRRINQRIPLDDHPRWAEATTYAFEKQSVWYGRRFFSQQNAPFSYPLFLAGKLSRFHYRRRPFVSMSQNKHFHHHTLILGSVGTSKKAFYKETYVNDTGPQEQVPFGQLLSVLAGYELGEFTNRPYFRVDAAIAKKTLAGYVHGSCCIGSFMVGDELEQGIVKTSVQYHTPLMHARNHRLRQFISLGYLRGIRLFTGEFVRMGEGNTTTVVEKPLLGGEMKLHADLDTVVWPLAPLWGFHTAWVGTSRIVVLQASDHRIHQPTFCEHVGVALRVRHPEWAFGTVCITFKHHPGSGGFGFDIGGTLPYLSSALNIREPGTIYPLERS